MYLMIYESMHTYAWAQQNIAIKLLCCFFSFPNRTLETIELHKHTEKMLEKESLCENNGKLENISGNAK